STNAPLRVPTSRRTRLIAPPPPFGCLRSCVRAREDASDRSAAQRLAPTPPRPSSSARPEQAPRPRAEVEGGRADRGSPASDHLECRGRAVRAYRLPRPDEPRVARSPPRSPLGPSRAGDPLDADARGVVVRGGARSTRGGKETRHAIHVAHLRRGAALGGDVAGGGGEGPPGVPGVHRGHREERPLPRGLA